VPGPTSQSAMARGGPTSPCRGAIVEQKSHVRRPLSLTVLVAMQGGCAGAELDAVQVVQGDSAGVAVVTIEGSVTDLPLLRLSEAEVIISGWEPPQLGRVGEVAWLSDGRIVVEDGQTSQLHLFAADGSHVGVRGGQGDGPGEFQVVNEITPGMGDTLYVFDAAHGRLSALHPDNGFLRSVTFEARAGRGPPRGAWALAPDRFLVRVETVYSPPEAGAVLPRRNRRDVLLALHDGVAWPPDVGLVLPGGFAAEFALGTITAPFANKPFVAVGGGRVIAGTGTRFELHVRDADLRHLREIRWPGLGDPIREDEVEAMRAAIQRVYRPAPPDQRRLRRLRLPERARSGDRRRSRLAGRRERHGGGHVHARRQRTGRLQGLHRSRDRDRDAFEPAARRGLGGRHRSDRRLRQPGRGSRRPLGSRGARRSTGGRCPGRPSLERRRRIPWATDCRSGSNATSRATSSAPS